MFIFILHLLLTHNCFYYISDIELKKEYFKKNWWTNLSQSSLMAVKKLLIHWLRVCFDILLYIYSSKTTFLRVCQEWYWCGNLPVLCYTYHHWHLLLLLFQIDWGAIDFDEPTNDEPAIDFGEVSVMIGFRC